MFLSRNKKSNVYPFKPQFYYIKVGFKGVKIIYACFRDVNEKKSSSVQSSSFYETCDFASDLQNREFCSMKYSGCGL